MGYVSPEQSQNEAQHTNSNTLRVYTADTSIIGIRHKFPLHISTCAVAAIAYAVFARFHILRGIFEIYAHVIWPQILLLLHDKREKDKKYNITARA